MPLFGKSKSKPEPAQAEKTQENKDALIQDFLTIIETQAAQINNLSHELKLKESVLDDCLGQLNTPQLNLARQDNEVQRQEEVVQLKDNLYKQGSTLRSCIRDAGQDFSNAKINFEKQLSQQQEELEKARNSAKHQATQLHQLNQYSSDMRVQLSEEKRESARLKNEISQAQAANSEAQKAKTEAWAARDAAQSQARREAETLGGQLDQKGQRIHELDEQIQTLTETIEQTRLALNRTRNELAQETRKARQGTEESATKSQQLEFVQQQCARLQEQLRDRTVATQKPKSIVGAGEDSKEDVGSRISKAKSERVFKVNEKDSDKAVECAQQ